MSNFIGIDLGGMSAKAGLMTQAGEMIRTGSVQTKESDTPEQTAFNLATLAAELVNRAGMSLHEISAIGIGSPGIIDSENGIVVRWTNFHWENVALAELVRQDVQVPVFITNDANAAALGEANYGSGKGYRDSVMITLGTGVGGGIIQNGKLVEGFHSAGGELGHMVIKRGGILCSCGRKGCFECYASATALKRETRKALEKSKSSLMWEEVKQIEDVSGKTAFNAAKKGDKVAQRVIKNYIENLGEGIVNIVNLLRPEVIILGGGVSNEGDALIKPLTQFVNENVYASVKYAPLEIIRASLGNEAGVYGAAQYAHTRLEQI